MVSSYTPFHHVVGNMASRSRLKTSPQRGGGKPASQQIENDDQTDADQRIEQSHSSCIGILQADHTGAVNIGADDIRCVVGGRAVQQHDLFKAYIHHVAQVNQQQSDDGGPAG